MPPRYESWFPPWPNYNILAKFHNSKSKLYEGNSLPNCKAKTHHEPTSQNYRLNQTRSTMKATVGVWLWKDKIRCTQYLALHRVIYAACACDASDCGVLRISRRSARIAYCGLFALSLIISWIPREVATPLMEKLPCKLPSPIFSMLYAFVPFLVFCWLWISFILDMIW